MAKPHRPRPKILNIPIYPIFSIYKAAALVCKNQKSPSTEASSLLLWATAEAKRFREELSKEPFLHREVYQVVQDCTGAGYLAPTDFIVKRLKRVASPTGVRGSLSRLVAKGFLVRPKTGYYWDAGIAMVP